MYKKQTKEIKEQREVVVAVICDNCGKEHKGNEMPDDWHILTACHDEWGNDSIDSYEKYMACSSECYIKLLNKIIIEYDSYPSTMINEMSIDFAKKLINFINTNVKK
jgi:hypothetical protein